VKEDQMMCKKYWLSFLLIVALSLTACSSQAEDPSEGQDKNKKAATEIEGILKQEPGPFSGKEISMDKLHQELDQLPDDMKADEAYTHLVNQVGEDYQSVAKKIENFDPSYQVDGFEKKGGDGKEQADGDKEKKQLHIEILLDASGSMAGKVNGKVKMEEAKEAIEDFVSDVPKDAKISLRVYGHKGSNAQKDKAVSCDSAEVIYPHGAYKKDAFSKALDQVEPTGWTPLAKAMNGAKQDLASETGKDVKNVVYVVSDGKETCGGDPVKEAQKLHKSEIEAVVNIIGFDMDASSRQALKKVAEAGGGFYESAKTGEDILRIFRENREKVMDAHRATNYRNRHTFDMMAHKRAMQEKIDNLVSQLYPQRGTLVIRYDREQERLEKAAQYLEDQGKLNEEESKKQDKLLEKRHTELKNYREKKQKEMNDQLDQAIEQASEQVEENISD